MSAAYVHGGVAQLAPIKYSSILINYLADILLFGYKFTFSDSVGTLIVFIGMGLPTAIEYLKSIQ